MHSADFKTADGDITKAMKVEISPKVKFEILIFDNELTVGWLYSQCLREITDLQNQGKLQSFDIDQFRCLKTKDGILNFDYILSDPGKYLKTLPADLIVVPYMGEDIIEEHLNFMSFKLLEKIGDGGFSKVFLVRKRDSGAIYAMKVVDKSLLIDHDKEEYLFNEKNIWKSIHHQRIVTPIDL